MTVHAARAHTRRRTTAALSGLAALALVLGACGEEGTAEDAVGSATSAVGSAAAQATSAVGDATRGDGTSGSETTAPGQEGQGGDEGEGGGNPDQEFLGDIRAIGVNVEDVRMEHAAGQEVGAVDLAVLPHLGQRTADELTARGMNAYYVS